MRNFRKKYFWFYAKKIAQNSLRFIRKNSAKVRKKTVQILRKRFSHFVETLVVGESIIELRIRDILSQELAWKYRISKSII